MHEISIVQALYSQVEGIVREHGARRALRIVVEVGGLSNVVPELLESAFLAFRPSGPCIANAELEVRRLPVRLRCRRCGEDFDQERSCFRCPRCSSSCVDITQGEELILRDLELEIES